MVIVLNIMFPSCFRVARSLHFGVLLHVLHMGWIPAYTISRKRFHGRFPYCDESQLYASLTFFIGITLFLPQEPSLA